MTSDAVARLAVSRGTAQIGAQTSVVAPAAVVAIAAMALSAAMLVVTARLPFDADGQVVLIERIPATWRSLLEPYHQHLNLIPVAIWDRMVAVFGTSSIVPFMVLLLATHIVLATSITAVLARRVGLAYAVGIGLPLALLGSSHYNFVSPWQILFTLTLLAGLAAVAASVDRSRSLARSATVSVALVLAVLTSNVAVFLIFGLWLWFELDGRRRQVRELLPAVLVFVVWFATFGRTGLETDGSPLSSATLVAIVPYTVTALGASAGMGLGPVAGAVVLGLLVRARPPRPMVAFLVAIVAMFAAAALVRSYGSADQAASADRYIYLAAYIAAFGVIASAWRPVSDRWAVVAGVGVAALNLAILAAYVTAL